MDSASYTQYDGTLWCHPQWLPLCTQMSRCGVLRSLNPRCRIARAGVGHHGRAGTSDHAQRPHEVGGCIKLRDLGRVKAACSSSSDIRTENTPRVRFSATVGEGEPEVKL